MELQRSIGNQAVQRLINSPFIQAKLQVSTPNDPSEQEADRVADTVMRMPEPAASRPLIQRAPLAVRKDDDDEEVQRLADGTSAPNVTTSVASNIQAMNGGGSPLPETTRSFFESRFGTDFGDVRVHTDSRATETARSINAKAFTVGQNVAFDSGRYAPETHEGRHLLAHELTHVVQQNRNISPALVQRDPIPIVKDPKPIPARNPIILQNKGTSTHSAGGAPAVDPETYLPFDTGLAIWKDYLDQTVNSFQTLDPKITATVTEKTTPPVKTPEGKDLQNKVSFAIETEGKGVPGQIKTDTELSAEYDFNNYKWVPSSEGGKVTGPPDPGQAQLKYPVTVKFIRTIKYADDKKREVTVQIYGAVNYTPEQWEKALGIRINKLNPFEMLLLTGNWGSYFWKMTGTGPTQAYKFENLGGGGDAPNMMGVAKDQKPQMLRAKEMPKATFMGPEALPADQFNGIRNYLDAADKIEADYQEQLKKLPKAGTGKGGESSPSAVVSGIASGFATILLAVGAVVAIAAFLAFIIPSLTFAAAFKGLVLIGLGVSFLTSLYSRIKEANQGGIAGGLSILGAALLDTFGVSGIIEAVTDRSILTGKPLNRSEHERWKHGTIGVLGTLAALLGVRQWVKGRAPTTTTTEGPPALPPGEPAPTPPPAGEPVPATPPTTEPVPTTPPAAEPVPVTPPTTEPTPTTAPPTTEPVPATPPTTQPAASNLKWGNPTSKPTYGHTFLDHTKKLSPTQLIDRARTLGHQVGQWLNDKTAAEFIADVAKRGPGTHDVKLPSGMGRSFLGTGTELPADMARIVVKPDGSVRTAFPFDSGHPQ